jgi:hypothetical protein
MTVWPDKMPFMTLGADMARPSRTGGKKSEAKARNAGPAKGRKTAKTKRRKLKAEGDPPACQNVRERLLIDDWPARSIDEKGSLLHQSEAISMATAGDHARGPRPLATTGLTAR